MWFIPLLVVGALALMAASKSREQPLRQLPPASVGALPPPPGPISVLGEILRLGHTPPPRVILCAIAEAEAIGRKDIVADIVRAFVAPVVYQHQMTQWRASCMLPPARSPRASCMIPPPAPPRQVTEDEILEMLHVDPKAFVSMATTGRPPIIDVPTIPIPPPAPVIEAAPGSPLNGIPDDAWHAFVTRLHRESPDFNSSRHIGQYRHRKERLAELGINPESLQGIASAQRAALDADLTDAYQHAEAGGLLDEHLEQPIVLPEHEGPQAITLSGILGVIQCAGLEGAAGWLENAGDRKRYPHTTRAFLHTNGIF